MTREELIARLRRLHTLLVIEKRSNNLALAIRKALAFIESWQQSPDEVVSRTPIKSLFAGYGPKFIRIFEEIMNSGTSKLIEELQGKNDPFFCELCEIPTIGVVMAQRMFFDRSIRTMDDLRIAYTNNVLQRIPAFGEQRLKAIEDLLWKTQAKCSLDTPSANLEKDAQPRTPSQEIARRNAKIFPSTTFHAVQIPDEPAPSSGSHLTAHSSDATIEQIIEQNSDIFGNSELKSVFNGESPIDEYIGNDVRTLKKSSQMEIPLARPREQLILTSPKSAGPQDMDKSSPYPTLEAEIGRFIAKDLAEAHRIKAGVHADETPSSSIIADRMHVKVIQARLIRAAYIQCNRMQTRHLTMNAGFSSSSSGQSIHKDYVCADEIVAFCIIADDIQADEVYCISQDCAKRQSD